MTSLGDKQALLEEILQMVRRYHDVAFPQRDFQPGVTPVPVSGKVFDAEELCRLVDSSLEFWLTTGRYADQFEEMFAARMGVKHALLCNSGSSANLLALTALTSPRLKDNALKPGDEVLTSAVGFPTTINPIIQNGMVPRLVDVELGTYNPTVEDLINAVTPKTRCIMLAHTLGNPFRADLLEKFCDENDIYLIEDTCDAVGATIDGKPVGSFGDLSTTSFYPAHHITMGEGGCVLTRSTVLKKIVESFRDWGRDCWCPPGKDNTCGKRFDWEFDDLPVGYDHKYVYSHIGYNLKLTDMQAAVGVAQLEKLDHFVDARRNNWDYLRNGLSNFEDFLILPDEVSGTSASWFGFALTVRSGVGVKRRQLIQHLESNNIATRLLFGGNVLKQPAYSKVHFEISGNLENADTVASNTFWIGVFPGLSRNHLDHIIETFSRFPR